MRVFCACVLVVLFASVSSAQNPLSALKALQVDGIGSSALVDLNECQDLAPSPFGSFVPPDVVVRLPVRPTTVTIPGAAFLPPAPRVCSIIVTGVSAGSPPHPPGQSTFRLELVVDFSTYLSNGSGGGCSQASGTLVFTKSAQGNPEQLTMNHAGLVCDTDGIGSAKTYTATYHATGGSKKYAGASGAGDVALSFASAHTLLHLEGNILFR